MFVNFNCAVCGCLFSVSNKSIKEKKTLSCPECKQKVPQKFLNKIASFQIDSSAYPFHVTFSSSPVIDFELINNAALNLLIRNLEMKGVDLTINSTNDISNLLNSENSYYVTMSLISGALSGYHTQIRKNLLAIGIDIGDYS